MNASDINSLQQLFMKAQRWQLTTTNYVVTKVFENCDVALFKSSINVNHCLRHLYPESGNMYSVCHCEHEDIIIYASQVPDSKY